jgi:hypothetical protein
MAGNASPDTDHRRNVEELLAQLAGMLRQDKLTEELRLARRRRIAARHAIMIRVRERGALPAA